MSVLFAMFLGLIQGIAEFLPISSSGHLSILQNFFSVENTEQSHMFFDVLLHLGTLISVFIVYRKDIWDIIKELGAIIRDIFTGRRKTAKHAPPPARRFILLVIVATLPLILVLPINDYIEALYYKTWFIGLALIFTGFLLFISDKVVTGKKTEKNLSVKDALVIGCMQAVAVIPGISRSGSTITAGLFTGCSREFAVKFSFIMSIPAILGANILHISDAIKNGIDTSLLPIYILGTIVAALAGYFAIKLVKLLSDKGKFGKFSYYCWAVGAITLIATFII